MRIRKGIECHMNLSGVMANSGFGNLRIQKGGISVLLPKHAIRKEDGMLKNAWRKRIASYCKRSLAWLEARGAVISAA